jgi:deazaflavin-dependent oxidoreductase (nitroreductase family)
LVGDPLLIMTSTGAKTGAPRRAILTHSRDGDDYVVAGTAGGAPTDPAWLSNIQAKPEVEVEVGNRTYAATARIVDEPDREPLWARHIERNPRFGAYPAQVGRIIPMARITLGDEKA